MPWWAIDTRLDAALVAVRRGELDEARRRLAAIRVPASAPLGVRLRERDVRAALAERAGRRADALGHIRRGLADLHEWQSSFGSLDLQTMVTGHGRRLAVRGLRVAVATGSPEVLFEWSERARMLASRVQPVRVPHDEQVLEDLQELRSLAAVEDPTREVAARQAELRERVRERAWQHRGSGEYDDPASPDDVQARLRPHQALVAYVVTDEDVTALVVTDVQRGVVALGPRSALDALLGGLLPDLDMAAAELPGRVRAGDPRRAARAPPELDDVLLAPLAEVIGDQELVLTPSGVLAGVPWSILPSNRGRPVIVAQSATSWLARTETRCGRRRPGSSPGPGSRRRRPRRRRPRRRGRGRWCCTGVRRRRPPSARWPGRSTYSTCPRTGGTPRRTRCSPASSSPTGRGSATTSTSWRGAGRGAAVGLRGRPVDVARG